MFGVKGRAHRKTSSTNFVDRMARLQRIRRYHVAARRFERRRRGERRYQAALIAMLAYQRRELGAKRPSNVRIAAALQATGRTWGQFCSDLLRLETRDTANQPNAT